MRTMQTTEDDESRALAKGAGRNPAEYAEGVERRPWAEHNSDPKQEDLLEAVVATANVVRAWKKVKKNKGAAGVDGRSIEETKTFLQKAWPGIKRAILDGSYRPYPVLRVEIPKADGGVRQLGIPTVVDRLIQQAICQVLTPIFDPEFSESSFGFRPGRSPHQAVRQALAHQQAGKQWVVDMDLKKFFDQVDHDVLMARVGRKVKDKGLKRLLNAYLKSGVLCAEGLEVSELGTPQGGPLSPLLSNVLLDDLDKELERRGLSFCRYADDFVVYVRTRRSGERVMTSVTRYLEDVLKLKVNAKKSAVARPWKRSFLSFTFTKAFGKMRISVPKDGIKQFRANLKKLFHKGRGRNLGRFIREDLNPVLRGWHHYFSAGLTRKVATTLDFWIRRHLRCLIWRQWKTPRTRVKKLLSLGALPYVAKMAWNHHGPWRNAAIRVVKVALAPPYFRDLDLFFLKDNLLAKRTTST